MSVQPVRVLFLSTQNSARSQVAEAFTRFFGKGAVEAFSAGAEPAERVHPLAARAMADVSIDIAGAETKDLHRFHGQTFDFVITVCERAKENCPAWPGVRERIHWSISDPGVVEGPESDRHRAFCRARDEIRRRVNLFLLANRIVTATPASPR